MPRELDTSRLQKFAPKTRKASTEPSQGLQGKAGAAEPWPSREASQEGQFTIRAPLDTITRFRKMCKDDRRTYADMLRILMDAYEENSP